MASYEDLLQYDIPSSLIENAPRTNVGIVSTAPDEFFSPRDPRIKNYLNYDVNTELNPWNPSSKFWPYEPDYAGIMSLSAYQQAGNPIYVDDLGMKQGSYSPLRQTFQIDPRILDSDDPSEPRDTIFHEGKHYFIDKYGNLYPYLSSSAYSNINPNLGKVGETALSSTDEHAMIYFADMFKRNPNYKMAKGSLPMQLNRKQAEAFMKFHNLGKKWFNNPTTFTGGIEPARETLKRFDLAGNLGDSLGDTFDERLAQYHSFRAPDRGSYTKPIMSQREMVREADLTGGTVNPFEATMAAYNTGGIASLML